MIATACVLLTLALSAPAQDGLPVNPSEEPPPDRVAGPPVPDAGVEAIIERLVGNYAGDEHSLHIARLTMQDLPSSVYVELRRDDAPKFPLWQLVWTFARAGEDEIRVRVSMFNRQTGRSRVFLLAWTSPLHFPAVNRDELVVLGDLTLTEGEREIRLRTLHPLTLFRAEAWDAALELTFENDAASWKLVATGPDGREHQRESFDMRRAEPSITTTVRDDGLVIIEVLEGEGEQEAKVDSLVFLDYTGMILTGKVIDSPTLPGRRRNAKVGAGFPRGVTEGMLGMKQGGLRRFILPPHMAWGARGSGPVPPNAWIIYDMELYRLRPEDN